MNETSAFVLNPTPDQLRLCQMGLFGSRVDLHSTRTRRPSVDVIMTGEDTRGQLSCTRRVPQMAPVEASAMRVPDEPSSPTWSQVNHQSTAYWLDSQGRQLPGQVMDLVPWQGGTAFLRPGGKVTLPDGQQRQVDIRSSQLLPIGDALMVVVPTGQQGQRVLKSVVGQYDGLLPPNFEDAELSADARQIWFRGRDRSYLLDTTSRRLTEGPPGEMRLYGPNQVYLRTNPLPLLLVKPNSTQILEGYTLGIFDEQGGVMGVDDPRVEGIRVINGETFMRLQS